MSEFKWTYMEHWRAPSPRGPIYQYASRHAMDRFIRQLVAVGFTGLDMFDFNLPQVEEMFGSLPRFEKFLQERGIEKLVNIFHTSRFTPSAGPHVAETHDWFFERCEALMQRCSDIAIENVVLMPLGAYPQVEPVTDEMINRTAEFWSRVGQMTLRYGAKVSAHHEFWGGIRSLEEIEKFYAAANPETVFFFCDAGQHAIAGVDPVALYERYHDRTSGFHFKDTHDVDVWEAYRAPADAELNAAEVKRWFWEMGTPEGLVDFPALIAAIRKHGYDGWLGAEHDKANIDGGSYAEATAVAMWYAARVLDSFDAPKAQTPGITWSYAINQWKHEQDTFVRRAEHERAFKTIAASGFSEVELRAGTGRWETLGRRELIVADGNYGSVEAFNAVLRSCGLDRVSSYFYDPATPWQEEEGGPRSPAQPEDHNVILASTRGFASFLAELGGTRLVVRPLPSYWSVADSKEQAVTAAAACWNAVGEMSAGFGVMTSVHVDCLSALQTIEDIDAFLALTDPTLIGLTLDTAELAISGIDPVTFYEHHHDRVNHLHFKDVYDTDTLGERSQQHADRGFLSAGGKRQIERWFQELGTPRGLVDLPALMRALARHGYRGTIVIESDQSPDPAGSTMANGWYVQRVLSQTTA